MNYRCWLVLIMLGLGLSGMALAQQQRNPSAQLSEPFNWYTLELRLGNRMLLAGDTRPQGPLVAVYSAAYQETMLGLNYADPTTNAYYAACCRADLSGNIDVQELSGPYDRPVLFAAGLECIAVGAEDGSLSCWLFAAGEYPREVTIARDYLPGSAFAVVVYPPPGTTASWEGWLVSAAYKPLYADQIFVANVDGNGAPRGGLPPRACYSTTNALSFTYVPRDDAAWLPYLLYAESASQSTEAYRNSLRIQAVLFNTAEESWQLTATIPNRPYANALAIGAVNQQPLALLAYPERDPYGPYDAPDASYVELRDLPWHAARAQSPARLRTLLPLRADDYLVSFVETPLAGLPLVAYSDGAQLAVARLAREPGLPAGVALSELVRHTGATGEYNGSTVPFFPITALCGTARGTKGYPEVYWIQDGTVNAPLVSQVFRLRFNPGE